MEKEDYLNLSNKELENMTPEGKINYFNILKEYAKQVVIKKSDRKNIYHRFVAKIAPYLRNYDFEVMGEENIPDDGKALFMCNHSNSHEFFTLHEAFDKIGYNISAFAASDGLNSVIKYIFDKRFQTFSTSYISAFISKDRDFISLGTEVSP